MELVRTGVVLGAKTPNVTEEAATRRLRGGILMLMIALGGAVTLESIGASPWFRLALFVPFFAAEYSFFQGIYRICGVAALRGMRLTSDGMEKIADPRERTACRCAGRAHLIHASFASSVLTALFVWMAY